MELQKKINKSVIVKVEGDQTKDVFKDMAAAEEVFGEVASGLCGCENIRMVVRKNKDEEDFYEYQCQGREEGRRCGAYLALGQNKKGGGLFPIRALIDTTGGPEHGKPDRERGKFGPHNGWSRYRGEPKA